MLEKKQPLDQLDSEVEIYPQVLKNVRVKDKKAAQEDADVQKEAAAVEAELGNRGRLLLRPSGTEPLIRVMVEAENTEICGQYIEKIVRVLEENGIQVLEMPSSELSRGRGGPRCMSMPLEREEI